MTQAGCVGFPVLTVKIINLYRIDICSIKTAQIDTDAIGIRAGGIESFDATVLAKSMLSYAGIKLIASNIIFTR
jgi:hypothetical protein